MSRIDPPNTEAKAPRMLKSKGWTVLDAQLLASAPRLAELPDTDVPEVALIGRSNTGKSTLINRLVQRKSLARVGATPGRTQHAVLFGIKARSPQGRILSLGLVDLPGFGYAKVGKSRKRQMEAVVAEYISARRTLNVVILLNDCRRTPQEDEFAVCEAANDSRRALVIAATKCDKLKRSESRTVLAQLAGAYGLEPADIVKCGEGMAVDELWNRIALLLQ